MVKLRRIPITLCFLTGTDTPACRLPTGRKGRQGRVFNGEHLSNREVRVRRRKGRVFNLEFLL
jgi:hypothetical protein